MTNILLRESTVIYSGFLLLIATMFPVFVPLNSNGKISLNIYT